ncbi:nucleotidyltransferase [Desemzia sp. RIT804]|uniref:nucleotidyltransferase n=1 Tax=Desemzia sp. RIT 804 TaxID=2810209 RepID=UPI00195007E2|nr:nucleotidyltransferase [Desemzia sp. RIT 804]MBM6613494.1 nucleotidyltransferase [Desemzia sp. RIT 804]
MKSCGIIAEYNPFHNGHQYQIQEAKKLTSAEIVIVVMSGNFLQRGEPAIVDKWQRTKMALSSGADLVIELPAAFSVQPADYFAKGGISLLQELRCDALSFGTESGIGEEFQLFAENWNSHEKEIDAKFKQLKNNGETYAAQMQQAVKDSIPENKLNTMAPNTILGLAYAKENNRYPKPMTLHPVKRVGSGYHEQVLGDTPFQSATALRKEMLEVSAASQKLTSLQTAVPAPTFDILQQSDFAYWGKFWPFLKYQLILQSEEQLREIYQMNEGIEYRLKQKVTEAETFEHFIGLVKTKRYPWVRLQRLFTYILLQFKKTEMQEALQKPKAIRVLGFTEKGQSYLSAVKKEVSLPIISRLNQKNKFLWEMDIRAGRVYQLAVKKTQEEQDFNRLPVQNRGRKVPQIRGK